MRFLFKLQDGPAKMEDSETKNLGSKLYIRRNGKRSDTTSVCPPTLNSK